MVCTFSNQLAPTSRPGLPNPDPRCSKTPLVIFTFSYIKKKLKKKYILYVINSVMFSLFIYLFSKCLSLKNVFLLGRIRLNSLKDLFPSWKKIKKRYQFNFSFAFLIVGQECLQLRRICYHGTYRYKSIISHVLYMINFLTTIISF